MRDKSFTFAFAFSAATLLFLISGAIGYTFSRDQVGHYWGYWTGRPVVWEVVLGTACGVIAAHFWRRTRRAMG